MKISVVILTLNSRRYIESCLKSVTGQNYDDLEIIAVDNSSQDSTVEEIRRLCPGACLIQNTRNQGASEGRNQAIDRATGDWLLTLDSDAILGKDFFSNFTLFLKNICDKDRIGIIAPKILDAQSAAIYSSGCHLTLFRRFFNIGSSRRDGIRFNKASGVFGACSATAFYRMECLREIKKKYGFYFDKDLFFMGEDVDLAWRAKRAGWKSYTCPACISAHSGNGAGVGNRLKMFYSIRNRFIMMKKNDSIFWLVFMFAPLFLYEVLRFLRLLITGEGQVYISACLAALDLSRHKRTHFTEPA